MKNISKDLTGMKFNRLIVIKRVDNYISPHGKKQSQWLCQCDCEEQNEIIVTRNNLQSGNTKSCGCLQKEKIIKLNKYNIYNLTGEFGIGYTNNNEEFYFDLEDYDKIKDYCWCKSNNGYIITNDYNKEKHIIIWMHRLITNCPDDMEVDHKFHDHWDNRKEFLRIVTRSQNQMNIGLKSHNTSGITGVSWMEKYGKWQAYININGKRINLGYYDDFQDAVRARKEAEEKYFGEYKFKDK